MSAGFRRVDGELSCDGVALSDLARDFGTPLYVYSGALIEENYRRFDAAFSSVPHLVCYAPRRTRTSRAARPLGSRRGRGRRVGRRASRRPRVRVLRRPVVFSGVGKTERRDRAPVSRRGSSRSTRSPNGSSKKSPSSDSALGQKSRASRSASIRTSTPEIPSVHFDRPEAQQVRSRHRRRARGLRGRRNLPGLRMTGVQAHIGSQIRTLASRRDRAGARDPRPRAHRARIPARDDRRRRRHRDRRSGRPRALRRRVRGGRPSRRSTLRFRADRAGEGDRGSRGSSPDPRPLSEAKRREGIRRHGRRDE